MSCSRFRGRIVDMPTTPGCYGEGGSRVIVVIQDAGPAVC